MDERIVHLHSLMKDITDQRFGRLIAKYPVRRRRIFWVCICDCGRETTVAAHQLTSHKTQSCGCKRIAASREKATTHGMRRSPEYSVWRGMLTRCYNQNEPRYKNYGSRGIKVCDKWHSFEAFYADMGVRPSPKHTIDRIDTDGNYEPNNCRWATQKQQQRNRSNNFLITYNGVTRCIAEWTELLGFGKDTIRRRLKRGWSVEDALTRPSLHQ